MVYKGGSGNGGSIAPVANEQLDSESQATLLTMGAFYHTESETIFNYQPFE